MLSFGIHVGAPEAKTKELEDVDSGWDDEDDEEDDVEDIDSGWGEPAADVAADAPPGAPGQPPPRALTPEEREARAARVAAKKERLRAKAAEKAERRRARAAAAAAKQKKSVPRTESAPLAKAVDRRPGRRVEKKKAPASRPDPEPEAQVEEAAVAAAEESEPLASSRPAPLPRDWRPLVVLAVLLVVAAGVALYLWKR